MTPNYRALCAELADELQGYIDYAPVGPCDEEQALVDRARVALAEPEPPADGEVAELVGLIREGVAQCVEDFPKESTMMTRAADLLERLAEPVPVGPTDDDLLHIFYRHCDSNDFEHWLHEQEFLTASRAVLARWGGHDHRPHQPSRPLPGG